MVATITYGSRFTSDCIATSETWEGLAGDWDETEDGNTCALTVLKGDFFQLNVTVSAGNKIAYYSYPDEGGGDPLADLDISRILFPKIAFRYKTSDTNIKAKIDVIYDDPLTQTVLAETSSTTWAYGTADLEMGTNIDHIRLYANQATGYVFYDFVMICEGVFTFPHVAPDGVWLWFPYKRAKLDVFGRDGGILQKGGMDTPRIEMGGTMEHGETWGGSLLTYGEYLLRVLRGMKGGYREPWQWLQIEDFGFKVIPAPKGLGLGLIPDTQAQRKWSMDFEVYSLSSLGEDDVDNLQWAGVET